MAECSVEVSAADSLRAFTAALGIAQASLALLSLAHELMIRHRIKPIEGFNTISVNTPPVYDAPTDSLQANNLRLVADGRRPLDIDFQGIVGSHAADARNQFD